MHFALPYLLFCCCSYLTLEVGELLTVNGEITVKGQSATGGNAGGGSGGSLYIQAHNVTGHGKLDVRGGSGSGNGGGGSGGRLSVKASYVASTAGRQTG